MSQCCLQPVVTCRYPRLRFLPLLSGAANPINLTSEHRVRTSERKTCPFSCFCCQHNSLRILHSFAKSASQSTLLLQNFFLCTKESKTSVCCHSDPIYPQVCKIATPWSRHIAESTMTLENVLLEPTLDTVKGILILDNDGKRILAKYFHPYLQGLSCSNVMQVLWWRVISQHSCPKEIWEEPVHQNPQGNL